jgi:hypothetical protein
MKCWWNLLVLLFETGENVVTTGEKICWVAEWISKEPQSKVPKLDHEERSIILVDWID